MKASVQISRGIESLFGTRDENIRLIESGLNVRTRLLNDSLEIDGEEAAVARAAGILDDYVALMRDGYVFNNGDLNSFLRVVTADPDASLRRLVESGKQRSFGKKIIAPKTMNQRRYFDAIERHDLVFGIGLAGTGKTYLAVAMAVSAVALEASQPYRTDAARGRSGGAPGISSRDAPGKNRSLPASAVRRAVRHDRNGKSGETAGT